MNEWENYSGFPKTILHDPVSSSASLKYATSPQPTDRWLMASQMEPRMWEFTDVTYLQFQVTEYGRHPWALEMESQKKHIKFMAQKYLDSSQKETPQTSLVCKRQVQSFFFFSPNGKIYLYPCVFCLPLLRKYNPSRGPLIQTFVNRWANSIFTRNILDLFNSSWTIAHPWFGEWPSQGQGPIH